MTMQKIGLKAFSWIIVFCSPLVVLSQSFSESVKEKKKEREWGKTVEGQAISIRSDKAAYAPEERIKLSITYKNLGQTPVKASRFWDNFNNFEIKVILADGKKAILTAYGKHCDENRRVGGGSASVFTLEPGKEFTIELPISRCFDFSLEEKYTIVVQREIASSKNPKKLETVASNKLEITIDEKLSKDEKEKSESK
jgi:hypothetical protein